MVLAYIALNVWKGRVSTLSIILLHIDGLVRGRRNSTVNALKLSFSCTNLSICLLRTSTHSREAMFELYLTIFIINNKEV